MALALEHMLLPLMERAGAEALTRFGQATSEQKLDGSVVTEADRAVEEVLAEGLQRLFPGEGIVGEEGTQLAAASRGGPTWYVDPIDGTSSFLGHLAYWGPTICRVVDGEVDVGAFYVPRLREWWYAERGQGAFRDGKRLLAGAHDRANRDILFVPSRFHRSRALAPWPGKVRVLGPSAAHMALVAAGAGACAVLAAWSLWDVGCGALLNREAGRMIWDPAGLPFVPEAGEPGRPFLVGTPEALEQLVADGWAEAALRRRRHRGS